MDYEYEDTGPDGRILWGRVALLAVALLLAFVLGRCTVSADPAQEEVAKLEEQVDTLVEENTQLQSQVDALEAGSSGGHVDQADDGPEDEGGEDAGEEGTSEGSEDAEEAQAGGDDEQSAEAEAQPRTHEVQEGDHLFAIAEEYYGDGQKFDLIADANDLSRDEPLRVGQTLTIPPDE